jgi:hypothetical protein
MVYQSRATGLLCSPICTVLMTDATPLWQEEKRNDAGESPGLRTHVLPYLKSKMRPAFSECNVRGSSFKIGYKCDSKEVLF